MCRASSSVATPFRSSRTSSSQAEDGELRLTATDMDLEVVESVAAEIAAEGATTVPAHTLYDIVRKLPDGASDRASIERRRRDG